MKILVTGANGFLGRGIVDEIIKTGHTVVAAGFETDKVSSDAIRINGDMFEVANPYEYYTENVAKSLDLFKNLNEFGCKNVIFSSSASVYDVVEGFKVTESAP